MIADGPDMITVLNYHTDLISDQVEVFALWHGGEHRVNDLILELGDIPGWEIDRGDDYAIATNSKLGAVLSLRMRKLDTGGSESTDRRAIPIDE